jgi:NAD(P)-dependent dehydrogenase (short-subunit alcohol dehydrogenase family)
MTMTRNAAVAFRKYRIRVNQLNVGWTLTENEEKVQRMEGKGPDWLADAIATRSFGRLLSPRDIALAAAYFASDDGAMITGAVLDLEQFPLGMFPE